MNTDILIVGSGCSGLYCALNLPEDKKITVITKAALEECNSFLAQGGICVLRDENDYDSFFEDTMKAGHYENDKTSVDIMIRSSREVINDLIRLGVDFTKGEDGNPDYTREGAHSKKRIMYHEDVTGKEITSKLLARVKERDNITLMEYTSLLDVIIQDNICRGAVLRLADGTITTVNTQYTVLATGGIGGLYKHSTNFRQLTADAVAIALKHGLEVRDVNYIQIHPTTFYNRDSSERSFLISESVRGEGAKLYNKNMERFVNELLPRDQVSKAIFEQMEKDGTEHVWEDLRPIDPEALKTHFPNIVEYCAKKGYDVTKECIPVVPAQHYYMGGVKVDKYSRSSAERLYVVGEAACNGVHGKNRLASNSLLESLVFARRAAGQMAANPAEALPLGEVDLSLYADKEKLEQDYKTLVLKEIERRTNNV